MTSKNIGKQATNEEAIQSAASSTSHATLLPRRVHRVVQNFSLVWLDANLDENDLDFKRSLEHLQQLVSSIETFTDADDCVNFLVAVEEEQVFMIVSGTLGQYVVPVREDIPKLEAIYVFCDDKSKHEKWTNKIKKINGVFTEMGPIYKALHDDQANLDRSMIPITFNRLDPLFMYTQLLKEAILEIEDDDVKSIKEFAEFCRNQSDVSKASIKKLETEYQHHSPIWWYTGPYFIYSMLNCGLRLMDADIIIKMHFFIRHLHNHNSCSKTMYI